jgi:hypothetical protein
VLPYGKLILIPSRHGARELVEKLRLARCARRCRARPTGLAERSSGARSVRPDGGYPAGMRWLDRITARKQPTLWMCCLPPGAQQLEQMRRQDHIAILAAFTLLDPDQHALAINVGNLERDHFLGAQTRSIGHAQSRLVFESWCGIEQARHLFRAEHPRRSSRLMDELRVLDDGISLEGHPLKKNRSADTVWLRVGVSLPLATRCS